MSNQSISSISANSSGEARPDCDPIALFIDNVLQLNNGAHEQIAAYLKAQPEDVRMRFIERCASLVSAVAEPH